MAVNAQWKANPDFAEYDEAKENIVLSAASIIEKVGIDKLRLDEVAKAAGCARPTLYRYFNSKAELITAVLFHYTMLNAEEITKHIEQFDAPTTRLVEIIYYGANNLRSNPVFKMFLESRNSSQFARLSLKAIPELLDKYLNAELLDGMETSLSLKSGISRQELFTWLVMQVYALADYEILGDSPEQAREFIRKFMIPGLVK